MLVADCQWINKPVAVQEQPSDAKKKKPKEKNEQKEKKKPKIKKGSKLKKKQEKKNKNHATVLNLVPVAKLRGRRTRILVLFRDFFSTNDK